MVSIEDIPAAGSDEAVSGAPRRIVVFLILAVVFAGAGAVRCYNINTPKFSFSPMRQHRSYAIARAFYFEHVDGLPEWRKEAALSNKENLETKEPAIMELLVSCAYRAAGGERAWIAPLFSSIFWLVGGVFVYLITIRYASAYGAAAATGFYLFVPFGFFVSRSFQPESFMIMLFLMSLYAIFRYGQKPSGVELLILAVISGFAILVKFVIIFPLWFGFMAGLVVRKGFLRALYCREHILFGLVGILPGLSYYLYMTFFAAELKRAALSIFTPRMLLDGFFWWGWLSKLGDIVGYIALAGGLMGILLVDNKGVRAVLAGLLIGHIVYCLIFSFTTATHDYYQVQLVPIVTLALAGMITAIFKRTRRSSIGYRRVLGAGVLIFFGVFLCLCQSVRGGTYPTKNKALNLVLAGAYKCCGISTIYMANVSRDFRDRAALAEEIGRQVNHSVNTISLGFAAPYWYYGEYAGLRWPMSHQWPKPRKYIGAGVQWLEYEGTSADELFEQYFAEHNPEYFVIVTMSEYEKLPGLREFLERKFELLAGNEQYLIYDLRSK